MIFIHYKNKWKNLIQNINGPFVLYNNNNNINLIVIKNNTCIIQVKTYLNDCFQNLRLVEEATAIILKAILQFYDKYINNLYQTIQINFIQINQLYFNNKR